MGAPVFGSAGAFVRTGVAVALVAVAQVFLCSMVRCHNQRVDRWQQREGERRPDAATFFART